MSKIFGFCIKHNQKVYDYCPLCEVELHKQVVGFFENRPVFEDEDEDYDNYVEEED